MKSIILVLLLGFSGCTFAFQNLNDQRLQNIAVGMTKQQVVEAMGKPIAEKIVVIDGKEYEAWKYSINELWAKKFNPIGSSYYRILFLDDKLAQWDRIKVFSNPSYELQESNPPKGDISTIKIFKEHR